MANSNASIKFKARPTLMTTVKRGLKRKCPHCGEATAFRGYLKILDECPHCAAPLGTVRADDAPPYFTIVLVGHIVIPLMFLLERAYQPELWVHGVVWLPLTVLLTLTSLPYIKGGVLGLMWGIGIRGDESSGRLSPP